MTDSSGEAREINLGEHFGYVLVKANGAQVAIGADGSIQGIPAPANDTAKAPHQIGCVEADGDHKGEIYGGIFPDGKPGWILEEPKPLTHYEAGELKGRALPTSEEGKYIDTIKDKGALKDIFTRHNDSSSFAGYFWSAEHHNITARNQQFSDGNQGNYGNYRNILLPVLCVRR